MHYQYDKQVVADLSANAINYINSKKLDPSPVNYAIVFDYLSGTRREVVQALEQQLKSSGALDESFMESLYEVHYLSLMTEGREAVEPIENIIEHIIKNVKNSLDSQTTYIESLEKGQFQLKKTPSTNAFINVLNELVKATETNLQQHKKLSEELEQTKAETEKLREELDRTRLEAITDPLTKLLNRSGLKQELLHWQENAVDCCVLLIDIDHFKKLNDQYGHSIGDKVLIRVAHELKEQVKGKDLSCRWGGEEFLVMLKDAEQKDGVRLADKLRQSIESLRLINTKTKERLPTITVSIGVSGLTDWDNWQNSIDTADRALYEAKQSGRNQVKSIS